MTPRYIIINNDLENTPEVIQNMLFEGLDDSNEYRDSELEPTLKMFADAGVPAVAVTLNDLHLRTMDEWIAGMREELEDDRTTLDRDEYIEDCIDFNTDYTPIYQDVIDCNA